MTYILAGIFGLSWGALFSWIDARTGEWLPRLCSAVMLITVAVPVIFSGAEGSGLGVTMGLTSCFAGILTSGVFWRGHPALHGLTYGGRVRAMLFKGSQIRACRHDLPNDLVDDEQAASASSLPDSTSSG